MQILRVFLQQVFKGIAAGNCQFAVGLAERNQEESDEGAAKDVTEIFLK